MEKKDLKIKKENIYLERSVDIEIKKYEEKKKKRILGEIKKKKLSRIETLE